MNLNYIKIFKKIDANSFFGIYKQPKKIYESRIEGWAKRIGQKSKNQWRKISNSISVWLFDKKNSKKGIWLYLIEQYVDKKNLMEKNKFKS